MGNSANSVFSKVSRRRILPIDQIEQSEQRFLIAIDDLLGPNL